MSSRNMEFLPHLLQLRFPGLRLNMRATLIAMVAFCVGAQGVAAQARAATQTAEFETSGDSWLDEEPQFLRVDEAFALSTEVAADGAILASWEIADGYYLYRHRFNFQNRVSADDASSPLVLNPAEIPPGKRKVDEFFGEVEVYYHTAQARIPVQSGGGAVELGIGYQGCADAGLCYPPETKWIAFDLGANTGSESGPGSGTSSSSSLLAAPPAVPQTQEQALAATLADAGLLWALAAFFGGGILLAFTPCVLPMVPILSSIIVGESENITRSRALSLSVAYVLGMAFTYAAVGTLVGLFGASLNLQAALQSAPVLIVFAIVFVLLSFSMFGFYELQLPQSWQNSLNSLGQKTGGGKHLGVVVMGSLSSLVVSPCVSAPLAGALVYISATGDALLGGTALLALGLGMGLPLIVIGASGGHLLPKAGVWMNAVKAVFGVGLLAVAIWLLERVVPAGVALLLWAALAVTAGVYLGALDFSRREGWGQLWKATGALFLVYGVLLMIGAASGAENPLKPLEQFAGRSGGTVAGQSLEVEWHPVKNLQELQMGLADAQAAGRPALLDLYADWCVSCKVMERSVFPDPAVESQLRQFWLLRADVTENNEADKALMDRYRLFGPPSMVFFSEDHSEMSEVRLQGEVGVDTLASHLEAILGQRNQQNFVEIAAKSD
ncbi:MAG: protein-disulfide reductase DsbD [Gammaproteobacteria bacterium]|nr:protein-disulfide reductase DsbD [Gammaproteobacteria bacterium]